MVMGIFLHTFCFDSRIILACLLHIKKIQYLCLSYCPIKQDCNPVLLIHVISRKETIGLDNHACHFQITFYSHNIYITIAFQSEFAFFYVHDHCIPFSIFVSKHRRIWRTVPQIFRDSAILLFHIFEYFIPIQCNLPSRFFSQLYTGIGRKNPI